MAIVIPVTVQGIRVASLAGQVSERKAVAARVADRALNELLLNSSSFSGVQSGTVKEGPTEYQWNSQIETWSVEPMSLVTVRVRYLVQGQEYDLQLSTLLESTTSNSSSNSTTGGSP